MDPAGVAVGQDPPPCGGAGQSAGPRLLHDLLVQRLVPPLVRLADEDAQQFRLTLQFHESLPFRFEAVLTANSIQARL